MMSKFKFFRGLIPANHSIIHEVHQSQKPGILDGAITGRRWRHKSMGKTLDVITNKEKYKELQQQAAANLQLWEQTKSPLPLEVEVVYKDWGVATMDATKKHGTLYSVLDMANPLYPGGAVLRGGRAQEENMWHRSTCPLSLLDTKLVYRDENNDEFLYTPEGRELVEARKKMTEEELKTLQERCQETVFPEVSYKTFHSEEPRVCFRGAEIMGPPLPDDEFMTKTLVADPQLSYSFLPATSIFPFLELRTAAPEHYAESQSQEPQVLKEHQEDLRRRIAAQLDTLVLAGQHNVILGAWGCGAFKNEPELVAEIYAEEIGKRAGFFQHIMFPIIETSHSNNFETFRKTLAGMKLGETSAPSSTPQT
jgi:hypothetical protein